MPAPIVVQMKMTGLRELGEALEKQPREIGRNIMRKGLKRAAGLWREEMKNTVRRGFHVFGSKSAGRSREWGFLAGHIGMKVSLRGDELQGSIAVGPVKKGFWALFLEFGTSTMPAFPFIRQAFETRKAAVLDKFIETIRAELAKLKAKNV
jgi:HK97 gp10 family phage protein